MANITAQTFNAIFGQLELSGAFRQPHLDHCRALGARRKLVMLAFPPKSAGTYFRAVLIRALDGQLARTVHAQGGRDAQPYLPTFLAYYAGHLTPKILVTHVHMLGLESNLHFLDAFGIRPVIMRRSIPDMLVSLSDMWESDLAARRDGLNCSIPESYESWQPARKADFLLDVIAPWYVNYYATWRDALDSHGERILVLDYALIRSDPKTAVMRSLAHVGLRPDEQRIDMALQSAWGDRETLRFNKGSVGRGAQFFDRGQMLGLRRLISFYPQLADWSDELLGEASDAPIGPERITQAA